MGNASFPISWESFLQEVWEPLSTTQCVQRFLGSAMLQPQPPLIVLDRFVLSSNLHKAVRFGLADSAAATAEALHRTDPVYFFRRLPIIALEDVSLGNLGACLEVLTFCRDLPLRRKFERMGLPAYLGKRLAAAPKSRSACDLFCLVEAQKGIDVLESELADLGVANAVEIACTVTMPLRQRAVSLLRLDRLPIRNGDPRSTALSTVGERLNLPVQVTQALVSGKSTESMSIYLPLILELMCKRPQSIVESDLGHYADSLDGPILYAALDMHTRLGQRAISKWVRSTPTLMGFFDQRSLTATPEKIVGMGLFHIESSQVNRRLTNDCLNLLQEECERVEMKSFGLDNEGTSELHELMRANHPALNNIRRRLWTS